VLLSAVNFSLQSFKDMIAVGETAPDFVVKDSESREISLKKLRGKFVLLLFYPGDNTRICTTQLCEYRDNWQEFLKLGIEVFGVNPASSESHDDFKTKNDFPFPLLSDESSAVAKKYDAVNFMGGTKRAYVLISPEGKILYSRNDAVSLMHMSSRELLKDIEQVMANHTGKAQKKF
jgi:peroxiredoxin